MPNLFCALRKLMKLYKTILRGSWYQKVPKAQLKLKFGHFTFLLLCFISFWPSFLVTSRFFLLPLLKIFSLIEDGVAKVTCGVMLLSLSRSLTSPSSSSSSSVNKKIHKELNGYCYTDIITLMANQVLNNIDIMIDHTIVDDLSRFKQYW